MTVVFFAPVQAHILTPGVSEHENSIRILTTCHAVSGSFDVKIERLLQATEREYMPEADSSCSGTGRKVLTQV